jgi:hypothetical protein
MSPELQAQFAAAVRRGDGEARAALLGASPMPQARVLAALHVHASTHRETLTGALRDSFPSLARHLAAGRFATLAAGFIAGAPPRQAALWFWGDGFADFLAAQALPAALVAVARLDRAWHHAFAAEDAPVLTAQDLSALPAEALAQTAVALHPAARLLTLPAGAFALWRAIGALPLADAGDATDADHVLLSRPEAQVRVQPLDRGEYRFLQSLRDGHRLLAAFEDAAAIEAGFALLPALSRSLAAGAFRSFTPQQDAP